MKIMSKITESELDVPDDYTTNIEVLDETYDELFPAEADEDSSNYDDDDEMPDPTFQVISPSDEEFDK